MASSIESSGEIESICQQELTAGQTARIVFRSWDDVKPPFTVKVRDPSGKTILDRVIRELPTGRPQSPPPVTFSVLVKGLYLIHIKELYGSSEGEAKLTVS